MEIETEYEWKTIVSEKEAQEILRTQGYTTSRLIVNTYFDYGDELLDAGITCRIRYDEADTRMTFKVPIDGGHVEYHIPITSAVDNGRSVPARVFIPEELKQMIQVPSLWPIGKLIVRRFDVSDLCPGSTLDKIEYPDGSIEWELETEVDHPLPEFCATPSKYQRLREWIEDDTLDNLSDFFDTQQT